MSDESLISGLERMQSDPRSTEELISNAVEIVQQRSRSIEVDCGGPVFSDVGPLAILHARGGKEVLDAALILCASEASQERALGASILGELGSPERAFPEECCDRLVQFLQHERDLKVVISAVFALGHLGNPRGIAALVKLKNHPDDEVRHGVAFSLACISHPDGVQTLLDLMRDRYECARDWATTGIGGNVLFDSADVRQRLLERMSDPDTATRAEAILGLVRRRDERVLPFLVAELAGRIDVERDGSYDYVFRNAAGLYLGLAEDDETESAALAAALQQKMSKL